MLERKTPSEKISITCTVNGVEKNFRAYSAERLLDVLRENAELTGTKEGCGEGECGACSVFVDGELVNSCLVPIIQMSGAKITTVEGLAIGEHLSQVQQAFLDHGGAQCGFCTPGMLMAATCLVKKNPNPTPAEIREGLSGNLCRCTGYTKIFESVVNACMKMQEETH